MTDYLRLAVWVVKTLMLARIVNFFPFLYSLPNKFCELLRQHSGLKSLDLMLKLNRFFVQLSDWANINSDTNV